MIGTLRTLFTRLQASAAGPAGEAPSGGDRFTVRRKPRMRHGYVTWPARPAFPAQLCDITDASFHGVSIRFPDALPDADWGSGVRLYLASENHEFDCQVAWQKGAAVGLRFLGRPKPPSRVYG